MKRFLFPVWPFLVLWPFTLEAWTIEAPNLVGWQTHTISVKVNSAHCPISEAQLNDLVDEATEVWNGVSTASITVERSDVVSSTTPRVFLNGTASDSPLILCDPSFGDHLGVNPDGVPAATKLGQNNPIDYGAIILNAEAEAGANISNIPNSVMVLILAHEMGHVMGLGHSSLPDALMYYSVGNKTKAVLTQDDINGISYLYPRNEFEGGAFGCAAVHRPKTTLPDLAFLMIFATGVFLCSGVGFGFRRLARRENELTSEQPL